MNLLDSCTKITELSQEKLTLLLENHRKNLKDDLLYFKNDILKDMKSIDSKLSKKYDKQNETINEKIVNYQENFNNINIKFAELSSKILNNNNYFEKIDKLNEFKIKTEDALITQNLIIKENTKKLTNAINKYDRQISDSVEYTGIIGLNCRYPTFHDFIDYVLSNISQFSSFKDKNILDFKNYKKKLENLIQAFKMQADSVIQTCKQYTDSCIKYLEEEKMKQILNNYDEKLFQLRLENSKTGIELEGKISEINLQFQKMLELRNELSGKFDSEVENIKNYNRMSEIKFSNYQKEFKLIKNRFTTLSEFIKDVRFRVNIGNLSKKEALAMSSKIDFTEKQILTKTITPKRSNLFNFLGDSIKITNLSKQKKYSTNSQDIAKLRRKTYAYDPKFLDAFKFFDKGAFKFNKKNKNENEDNYVITEENSEDIDYINIFNKKKLSEDFNKTHTNINTNLSIKKQNDEDDDIKYSIKNTYVINNKPNTNSGKAPNLLNNNQNKTSENKNKNKKATINITSNSNSNKEKPSSAKKVKKVHEVIDSSPTVKQKNFVKINNRINTPVRKDKREVEKKTKINIIDINSLIKEKRNIVKDGKSNEKNLNSLKENEKMLFAKRTYYNGGGNTFRKMGKSNSDINIDNNSYCGIIINNNVGNNYYYSLMQKEDLKRKNKGGNFIGNNIKNGK